MWDMEPRKVLVGVETAGCEAALRYAVDEAVRRGCGIHLAHVGRLVAEAACALDDVALVSGELRRTDRQALADAAARAEALIDQAAPDDDRLSVSTELTHGSVVVALQALSRHAAVMVLQHHGMGPHGDTATLSVSAGLAAVAHCPVLAVPDSWRPGPAAGAVVLGVDDPERDRALVEAARHEADRRGARLVEVHVEDGPAGETLLQRAAEADLVIVGRHHRTHVVGAPLGRTARELLRRSAVPVLVVDPVRGDRRPSGTELAATSRR